MKKNKVKKRIVSVLAFSLVISLLMSACGAADTKESSQKETQKSSASSASSSVSKESESKESSAASEVPGEPVVLTVLMQDDGFDYASNPMTKYVEEQCNVKLNITTYTKTEGFNTAYNLLLASEEYPDIIMSGLSREQILAGMEAGALLPLNDYIVEGTNYKAALEKHPEWNDYLTATDGNIYSFFLTDTGAHQNSQQKMFYKVDWMEKLGWENPPSTPEEFKEYLIDVRDNDLNGNGKTDDEIPLVGWSEDSTSQPVHFLMNPFELATSNYFHITDDGELYFEAITDGWRKGLAYIADLYAEGLLAEETFVQDRTTFKALLNKPTEEEMVVATYPGVWQGKTMDTKVLKWTDYQPLAPLKGDYQQTASRVGETTFSLCGAITTSCENPDAAFAVMDFLIDEETAIVSLHGVEGVSWKWVNDKENYLGTTPSIDFFWIRETGGEGYRWMPGRFPVNETLQARYGVVKSDTENSGVLLEAAQMYEPYYVCDNVPIGVWADEQLTVDKMEYATLINGYIKTSYAEFILGIRDINDDKQWKAYLDELDAMGLDEYIEILNTYYGLK